MRLLKTPAGQVHSLRFSPDGRSAYLLSDQPKARGCRFGHAFRVDVASGIAIGDWQLNGADCAIFSPDLRSIYSTDSGDWMCHLRRLNLATGQETELLRTDNLFAHDLALTPNEHILALAVLEGREEKEFRVRRLDVLDGFLHGLLPEAIRTVALCLAYSPDGSWLATGSPISELSPSTGVRLWKGRELVQEFSEPARHLAWSPYGQLAWGMGNSLAVATPGTAEAVRTWEMAEDELATLAFSPNSRLLLTGNRQGTCAFHDPAEGQQLAAFDWGIGPIHSVAFAPDGLTCAAGGENGQVVVWDVDS